MAAELVGLVGTAIRVATTLQQAIEDYRAADEVAQNLVVFGTNLTTDTLYYLRKTVENQTQRARLRPGALSNLAQAVKALTRELEEATAYFVRNEPDGPFQRIWWVMRAKGKVINLNQALQGHINIITGHLQLVEMGSPRNQEGECPGGLSFDHSFRPEPLDGLVESISSWTPAHYSPVGADNIPGYDPNVHILIERGPGKDSLRTYNLQHIETIATHLRGIAHKNPNAGYLTGLLPCIGYASIPNNHRRHLVFLLPRNADVSGQPTSLQKAIVESRSPDTTSFVTLEMRFQMALQLARAVLTVHEAGFSHCSIRSDQILFIQPRKDEATRRQRRVSPTTEHPLPVLSSENDTSNQKPSLVRRATAKLQNRFTHKETPSVAGDKESGKEKTKLEKRASMSSFKFKKNKSGEPKQSVEPARPPMDPSQKDFPQDSALELGMVPPGGSVFLTYWRHMREHTAARAERSEDWFKDLYRHPSQQGKATTSLSTGHEVYSLGVCLLEIGLWDALVWTKVNKKGAVSEMLARRVKDCTKPESKKNLKDLMKEKGGPEKVRQILVHIATYELPKTMGTGYTNVVLACLECVDGNYQKYWNAGLWEENKDLSLLEKQKQVCEAFRNVLVDMLSSLSSRISCSEGAIGE